MGKTKSKAKFYAVAAGRAPGIYSTWPECERQVKGFSGAKFKSFKTRDEAVAFVGGGSADSKTAATSSGGGRDMKAASLSSDQKRTISVNSTAVSAAKRPRTAVSSGSNGNDKGATAVIITVYFDGGARGNPGVAGAGAVITRQICGKDASRVVKVRQYCGPNATNNVAEYTGLLIGLRTANEFAEDSYVAAIQETVKKAGDGNLSRTTTKTPSSIIDIQVKIRGDSDLIIKQMNGQYRCNNAGLIPLYDDCRSIASQLKMLEHSKLADEMKCRVSIDISHVYRDDNKVADALANEAMDERRSWRTEFTKYASGYEEELGEVACGKGDAKKAAVDV